MSQLNITLTPELDQLINDCVAEKVKLNGKFISRQQFIKEEMVTHLTKFLEESKKMAKESK